MSFPLILPPGAAVERQVLRQQILTVDRVSFEPLALAVFRYQAVNNPIYRDYLRHLSIRVDAVETLRQVPFMPIGFFKKHTVLTGSLANNTALTFASSGTTGEQTSRHLVPDPDLYDAVSTRIFEQTYGPLRDFHILALLPSYLERNNSSLVYMVQRFMRHTGHWQAGAGQSGFYLNNYEELTNRLRQLTERPDGRRILLIGVTFGLLDWAESAENLSFLAETPNLVVMETGGMKGRRRELLREEVHDILTRQLGVTAIHSEYGMTELLSQAYSMGEGVFRPSPTLRVLLRDINDPFALYADDYVRSGLRQTGGINVVDLANLDSCAFIETQDLGQYVATDDASAPTNFRVIGRFDNSDVRGCNLLVL